MNIYSSPTTVALLVSLVAFLSLGASPVRAESIAKWLEPLIGGDAEIASVPRLLLRMANDEEFEARVLEVAGPAQRALTDSLLSFLRQGEPVARKALPEMYEVSDLGPPLDQRPAAWADVRLSGVKLFLRVALREEDPLDLRLRRRLNNQIASMTRARPAGVGGLVVEAEKWWSLHGGDPSLTHDSARIPDLTPWLEGLDRRPGATGEWSGLTMLVDLDRDARARNMLLENLSPDTHAHLVAECMEGLRLFPDDLVAAGVPAMGWDPERGRVVGHRAVHIWERALEVLDRVLPLPASGADTEAILLDRLSWWRRARFEARYWRDPLAAPDLAPWFEGVVRSEREGGPPAADWLRGLYVAEGFRDLLLDHLGSEHASFVSELVAFLPMDTEQARRAGFNLSFTRRPLRGGDEDGLLVAIPWSAAQDFTREVLGRILHEVGEAPPEGADESAWMAWWSDHAHEDHWYRDDEAPRPKAPAILLEPERSRVRG